MNDCPTSFIAVISNDHDLSLNSPIVDADVYPLITNRDRLASVSERGQIWALPILCFRALLVTRNLVTPSSVPHILEI